MTPTGRVAASAPVGVSMTPSSRGGFRANSPVPYLFGGIAVVVVLIAVALILIAFSNKKRSSSDDQKGGASTSSATMADYIDPRIAVFMPGEKKPTFLANPVELRICVCNRSTTDDDHRRIAAEPAAAEKLAAGADELV